MPEAAPVIITGRPASGLTGPRASGRVGHPASGLRFAAISIPSGCALRGAVRMRTRSTVRESTMIGKRRG
jgi:hypothetical protein